MSAALAGFLAGLLHVLSGPDHLAAVAPYAAEGRRRAWLVGARWGLGHAAGALGVGLLAFMLRELLPAHALASWSERLVGAALIGIGLWGLRAAWSRRIHTHEHSHGGPPHLHIHLHGAGRAHGEPEAHAHTHAAFAVGVLHGAAGGSHLLGAVPALALPSVAAAGAYLSAFGLGSIAGMTAFTWLLGVAAGRASARGPGVYRGFLAACSAAGIGIGLAWLAGIA